MSDAVAPQESLPPITWTNAKRRLGDLVPWERNPRQIEKLQAERLLRSLDDFGQIHAIAIGPENQIYDGHQRDSVWAASEKYGPGFEVDVRVSSRPLTEKNAPSSSSICTRERLAIGTGTRWRICRTLKTPT